MEIVVVATDKEYEIAKKRFKGKYILKTGVGGLNVYNALKRLPKWLNIINFGYVGSNVIPRGTEVYINKCSLYHPNVDYIEPTFDVDCPTWIKYRRNETIWKY